VKEKSYYEFFKLTESQELTSNEFDFGEKLTQDIPSPGGADRITSSFILLN